MSRTPFDTFAKDTMFAALQRAGHVETQSETRGHAQYVDLYFEPDAARLHTLKVFGWLHRIAATGPALMEFFHEPPDIREVRACITKHGVWIEKHAKLKKPAPHLWLICAGRPQRSLTALGFRRNRRWPSGTYTLPPGWGVTALVVSELPRVRQTLLLRLLGAGRVLSRAIIELDALPVDEPEPLVAAHNLIELLGVIRGNPAVAAELEDLMNALQRSENWRNNLLAQGRREGRREARQETVAEILKKQLKLKFPRTPAADLARIDTATLRQLSKWSERVLFAETIKDVFR